MRRVGKGSGGTFEEGRVCKEAIVGIGGGVSREGRRGEWVKWFMRILRDMLKAGVVS